MGILIEKNNNYELKYEGICYKFQDILVDFIYTDYTEYINKLLKETSLYIIPSEHMKLLSNFEIKLMKLSSKKGPIHSLLAYEVIRILRSASLTIIESKSSKYDMSAKEFEEKKKLIYPDFNENANFFYEKVINQIRDFLSSIPDLQNHVYEAINICLNKSHPILSSYTLAERINYYYKFDINILKNGNELTNYNEIIIDSKHLQDTKYAADTLFLGSDIHIFKKGISTDVISRLNEPSLSNDKKSVINIDKNYNLNTIPKHNPNIKLIKSLQFNNLIGLIYYCFIQSLNNYEEISIKECNLCKKFFITTNSTKEYCDRKINNSQKLCSDNYWRGFIKRTNQDELEKKYTRIYKRLYANNRRCQESKNIKISNNIQDIFSELTKCYNLYKKEEITKLNFEKILKIFNSLKPNPSTDDITKLKKDINSLVQ